MKRLMWAALAAALISSSALAQTSALNPIPLRPDAFAIGYGTTSKVATAVAGAATLNKNAGVVTSESLTTAAAASYTLTITDSFIMPTDTIFAAVTNGSNTGGAPVVTTTTAGTGTATIVVRNDGASAFTGTLKIGFFSLKQ